MRVTAATRWAWTAALAAAAALDACPAPEKLYDAARRAVTKRRGAFRVRFPCAQRGAGVLLNISAKFWRISRVRTDAWSVAAQAARCLLRPHAPSDVAALRTVVDPAALGDAVRKCRAALEPSPVFQASARPRAVKLRGGVGRSSGRVAAPPRGATRIVRGPRRRPAQARTGARRGSLAAYCAALRYLAAPGAAAAEVAAFEDDVALGPRSHDALAALCLLRLAFPTPRQPGALPPGTVERWLASWEAWAADGGSVEADAARGRAEPTYPRGHASDAFRGDGSRRRRGCRADIPRRVELLQPDERSDAAKLKRRSCARRRGSVC